MQIKPYVRNQLYCIYCGSLIQDNENILRLEKEDTTTLCFIHDVCFYNLMYNLHLNGSTKNCVYCHSKLSDNETNIHKACITGNKIQNELVKKSVEEYNKREYDTDEIIFDYFRNNDIDTKKLESFIEEKYKEALPKNESEDI